MIVGITSSAADKEKVTVHRAYINAITAAGGVPVVLPNKPGLEEAFLNVCDGFLFSGGGDVLGKYFGQETHEKAAYLSEERDEFEISLAKLAFKAKKPVLGICRGMQIVNIALGGDIIQHIEEHAQSDPRHAATHYINIAEGSMLYDWLGKPEIKVNSFHHQATDKLAPGFAVSAKSGGGFTEAVEYKGDWFCIGVQWHPEAMLESPEHIAMLEIFKAFIGAASAERMNPLC